jgi:hypothetical protein
VSAPKRPRARLTQADQRAIGKLLAEGDDREVWKLGYAIRRYEATVSEARARLTRRRWSVGRPMDDAWFGGYANAMDTVLTLLCEMVGARTDHDVVLALAQYAIGAREAYYADTVPASWWAGERGPGAGPGDAPTGAAR